MVVYSIINLLQLLFLFAFPFPFEEVTTTNLEQSTYLEYCPKTSFQILSFCVCIVSLRTLSNIIQTITIAKYNLLTGKK